VLITSAVRVEAWGPAGHHIVARLALAIMKPETVRAAQEVLGNEDFVSASTWADEILPARPQTAAWHVVEMPIGSTGYDRERDCRRAGRLDCVVEALLSGERMLGAASRAGLLSLDERRERLKFYLNLVGEIHQPLNCADNGDHGGRDVKVHLPDARGEAATVSLYALWDSALIDRRGLSEDAYLRMLIADLSDHPMEAGSLNPADWAVEAHAVAADDAYRYANFVFGKVPAAVVTLDAAYLERARTAVDRQLERAGVRLARMLDILLN
jgi:nuclease S1